MSGNIHYTAYGTIWICTTTMTGTLVGMLISNTSTGAVIGTLAGFGTGFGTLCSIGCFIGCREAYRQTSSYRSTANQRFFNEVDVEGQDDYDGQSYGTDGEPQPDEFATYAEHHDGDEDKDEYQNNPFAQ